MTSIVRDGNHFILDHNERGRIRWILIDGPWFDRLQELAPQGMPYVLVREYQEMPALVWRTAEELDTPPIYPLTFKALKWHQCRWTNGIDRNGIARALARQRDRALDNWRYNAWNPPDWFIKKHGWVLGIFYIPKEIVIKAWETSKERSMLLDEVIEFYKKLRYRLEWDWQSLARSRMYPGWIFEDGQLPAHFNSLEPVEEYMW